MKITIEPTTHIEIYPTASISQFDDDLNIGEVIDLFRSLLIAWGFSHRLVDEKFCPPMTKDG